MTTVLIIIDMQEFIVDRMNKGIEFYPENAIHNMQNIIRNFRYDGNYIIHVRHHTPEDGSLLHHSSPLAQAVKGFEEEQGEPVFIKNKSSEFSSTNLFCI